MEHITITTAEQERALEYIGKDFDVQVAIMMKKLVQHAKSKAAQTATLEQIDNGKRVTTEEVAEIERTRVLETPE